MALFLVCAFGNQEVVHADEVPSPAHRITGEEFDYTAKARDTLRSLGARYGVSLASLSALNHLNPNIPLKAGQIVHIDNRHIPPGELERGILINVPQRMLFFFDKREVRASYPVAVGKPDWETTLGVFTVTALEKNPTWFVPESIQDEMEDNGEEVRTVVPPGPKNPLGRYAIHLSIPGYLVHGTNAPWGIYSYRTHGCIRLHPDDAEALYRDVKIGDGGAIVYRPALLAVLRDGQIFAEVNRDGYHRAPDALGTLRALAETANVTGLIDWTVVTDVIKRTQGIAREVDIKAATITTTGTSGQPNRLPLP